MHINFRHKKGSALATTLIMFLIVALFGTIVITIANQNLLESKRQESSIEAYYLAYSGVEMAFSSLKANDNLLFEQIKQNAANTLVENDISFGNGTIDIAVRQASQTAGDPQAYAGWIKISSIATLDNGSFTKSRVLYIDPNDQRNIVWE
ncbi:MAG: hypothetical protein PHC86_07000 [Eubacteriales bacterium]|nr:hypothetical protein [Eubacteriales bacterium]